MSKKYKKQRIKLFGAQIILLGGSRYVELVYIFISPDSAQQSFQRCVDDDDNVALEIKMKGDGTQVQPPSVVSLFSKIFAVTAKFSKIP